MKFTRFFFLICMIFLLSFPCAATDPPAPGIVEDIVLKASDGLADNELLASNYQVGDSDPTAPVDPDEPFDWADWFFGFLAGLIPESIMEWFGTILIVGEIVVRATPTTTDDKWFLWVKRIIDSLLPSRKKGGGSFPRAKNTPV